MGSDLAEVQLPELSKHHVSMYFKREDLRYPNLSGNKYRKLKYNLSEARSRGYQTLMTFGGAYSNHLHATAAAGAAYGFQTIGFVRGQELGGKSLNPTLAQAQAWGMKLKFLSREDYRRKSDIAYLKSLLRDFGPAYVIPEGGTNALAVKGCAEILETSDRDFTHICCPVGTGGTLAGLALAAAESQRVVGYSALKAPGFEDSLRQWIPQMNWSLVSDSHFGGYAKTPMELVTFINEFKACTGIPLDPVYTGKMAFGILRDVRLGRIPSGSRILAIHTGGLQGIEGMNMQLKKKNLPLLHL